MQSAEELGAEEEENMGMAQIPRVMLTPTGIAARLRPELSPKVPSPVLP